jgi:hypothetical protein
MEKERPAPPEPPTESPQEPPPAAEDPLEAYEELERAGFEKIKRKRTPPREVRASARRDREGPPPRKRR